MCTNIFGKQGVSCSKQEYFYHMWARSTLAKSSLQYLNEHQWSGLWFCISSRECPRTRMAQQVEGRFPHFSILHLPPAAGFGQRPGEPYAYRFIHSSSRPHWALGVVMRPLFREHALLSRWQLQDQQDRENFRLSNSGKSPHKAHHITADLGRMNRLG